MKIITLPPCIITFKREERIKAVKTRLRERRKERSIFNRLARIVGSIVP